MEPRTPKPRRFLFKVWFLTGILLLAAYEVSLKWGINYAHGRFFFVLTDGYIVLPLPDDQPQTWGDWGWWMWSPWSVEDRWFRWNPVALIPWILNTRGIGGLGLHIPIPTLMILVTVIPVSQKISRLPHPLFAVVASIGFFIIGNLLVCALLEAVNVSLARILLPIELVLSVSLFPMIWMGLHAWIRSRRIPWNHCQSCGYNLTGNVSGRCPECGTVVLVPLGKLVSENTTSSQKELIGRR